MKTLVTSSMLASAMGVAALCAACSTTGTAVGRLEEPTGNAESVTLVWKSDASAPDRGVISGTLPDGTHYSGRYYEVVKTAAANVYVDAWGGWPRYWSAWRAGWYPGLLHELDWPGFVDIYTGRVIANLKSDDAGSRLRCRFQIDDPLAGLSHGGHGECQLSNGESIDHVAVTSS